jgi:outer membrane protein TolC
VLALFALIGLGSASTPVYADSSDPFSVRALAARSPLGSFESGNAVTPCGSDVDEHAPLSLAEVVDRALCQNPQTRTAWANARVQAAQVGVARSAYLPSVSATASDNRYRVDAGVLGTTAYSQRDTGLSAAYLLYDFGARDATLETAVQTLAAANFSQDAALQKVFLAAVQAYYQLFAAREAVDSTLQAEGAALVGLKAATARYDASTGTPADKLQAQTAYSQAKLNRIQAEGIAINAEGALANAMGLDANRPLRYVAPVMKAPEETFDRNLEQLIGEACRRRPDLAAAEARVKVAEANVRAVRAAGMPTVSLSASPSYAGYSLSESFYSQTVGVTVSIPVLTGFSSTYQIRAAQAQADSQAAQRDNLNLQVALDV